ncbi:hypothetical protein CU098_002314, partial [Rhizopus stolonifer]
HKPYGWWYSPKYKPTKDNFFIGFKESVEYIKQVLIKEGPFDGILGFSQGFKPTMQEATNIMLTKQNKVKTPSLHYIGELDTLVLPEAMNSLSEAFVKPTVFRHSGGHYLPSTAAIEAMQQFTPYFPGYDATQQAQQAQAPNGPPQEQTPLAMNGQSIAIYSPMPALPVLSPKTADSPSQAGDLGAHGKPKRKQVKNACVRKERKKGIKRGPYKKRNKNVVFIGVESAPSSGASTPNMASPMPNPNMYVQNSTAVRSNNAMPMHYQPFAQEHYGAYDSSHATTPSTNPAPGAVTTTAEGKTEEDDDDEGSKLNILSQLCSAVLDGNENKQGSNTVNTNHTEKLEESHQNTPPPSRPHSRETSHDNGTPAVTMPGPNFGTDSPHTYINGHLTHRPTNTTNSGASTPNTAAYGTPGSSPTDSPLNLKPQVWNSSNPGTPTEQ